MIPNYDPAAGIHYGCISQHSLDHEAMSDIDMEARDLSHESAVDEAKNAIIRAMECGEDATQALEAVLRDYVSSRNLSSVVTDLVEMLTERGGDMPTRDEAWDVVEQEFNDHYDCDDRSWLWEKDGYALSDCLISDIFVSKSPYFTYAPECSPCVPNAGNLDSAEWFEGAEPSLKAAHMVQERTAKRKGWLKTYCLGHDLFEGQQAPYPVWSVGTGNRVVMVERKEPCPNCNGTGRDSLARIAKVRGVESVSFDDLSVEEPDASDGTFKCFRCAGYGHEIKKVQEEIA